MQPIINRKIYIVCIINNYTMVIQTKSKIREWGNSFGIVIPKEIIIKEGLVANEQVIVSISRKQTLEDFFGKGKGKIKDAQKVKNEARKLWKMD